MAQPEIVIDQAGPLPITRTITEADTGPATLVVSGSVWATQPNVMVGVNVLVDGRHVGQAVIFSNGADTHRAVVPVHIPINLNKQWEGEPPRAPQYQIELAPLTGDTTSDLNDWFQVALIR